MATTTTTAPRRALPRIGLPEAVSALAERDFRVIWIGQAVSMTGTWMQGIAQGLLVLQLWDSAFALGAVNFANALPSLLVMLFGGVLADRADKRRILLITQIVMGALALSLALLVASDTVQFWMIIVAAVGLGIAFGYDMPAFQAFLPELVPPEKISQVVALNSSTFHGSRMVGPAVAGIVIGALGLAAAYFINAASFLAVIIALLMVRPRPSANAGQPRRSAIEDLKAGLSHARGRPNLIVLLVLMALALLFLFPAMAILSPYYVKNVLHEGSGVLGLMWAMSGVGSLIGALMLVWWPRQARVQRIWVASLVGPAALAVLALTTDPVVAIVATGFASISFSSQLGIFTAMMQESTPAQFRGRVMALNGITFNGTMPVAGLISSGAAVAAGLPAVYLASAALYLVLAVALLRFAGGGIDRVVDGSRIEFEAIVGAGS